MYEYFAYIYDCVPHAFSVPGGQKMVLDPLGVKL